MKASDVMKRLSSGEMISILKEIYSEKLDQQILRYKDAVQSFIDYFGDQDIMIISVPGKCEIGGNHTDHQRGRVLASAIQLDSIAIIAKQERYAKVIYNEMSINEIDTENIKYNEAKKGTMESLPPYDNLRTYNGIIDQWCFIWIEPEELSYWWF